MEDYTKKFQNHKLIEVLNTKDLKVFEFRQDKTSNHYQRWIIDKGTLIITGDNGSAIYNWNNSGITLKFLAECNLGYFNEKCLADKDGKSQRVYCEQGAESFMKEIAFERIYDSLDEEIEGWSEMNAEQKFQAVTPKMLEELEIDDYELENMFCQENIHDAMSFMFEKNNEFMFGSEPWEYFSHLESLTWTPKLHLTALKVAYSQNPNAF